MKQTVGQQNKLKRFIVYLNQAEKPAIYIVIERSGSGVELRTLDLENPGSNPVLWC